MKGKAYYPRIRGPYNATCDSDSAYIFSGTGRDGKYHLNIEKRELRTFRQLWSGIVVVSGIQPPIRDDVLKVQAVKKVAGGVNMELVNEESGQVFIVQAPLFDK